MFGVRLAFLGKHLSAHRGRALLFLGRLLVHLAGSPLKDGLRPFRRPPEKTTREEEDKEEEEDEDEDVSPLSATHVLRWWWALFRSVVAEALIGLPGGQPSTK